MVLRLKKHKIDIIPEYIEEKIRSYKYSFNPSYAVCLETKALSIRLYNKETDKIEAHLFIWSSGNDIVEIDLSSYFEDSCNIAKVADPKLFVMDNCIWGTFNTGHVSKGSNELFLFKIENSEIATYYACKLAGRRRIEKNWSFYSHSGNVYALYGLDPVTVLKAVSFEKNEALFEYEFNAENIRFKNYTIGTPLTRHGSSFCFVAHKKIFFFGKRLYFGKVFFFNPTTNTVNPCKTNLIHSYRDLPGNRHKFNRNLISCTYFSGIHISNDEVFLCYGINDVDWSIASLKINELCR